MPTDGDNRLNAGAETFNPLITNVALQQQIQNMVAQAINIQGREIISSIIHPENTILKDEVILEEHINKIDELDRIPDVVRCLREFNGNSSEYSSWKKNVERILALYEDKRGTPKYYGILSVVRNKIIGNADQVLESYNTPLNWGAIVKCLNTHYADKRDIGTLEYQMTTLVQGNDSIEEFYQKVYAHLSLILNKISCAEFGSEATNLLSKTYREKGLDTFIRGLNGQLPSLLAMKEPVELPQALQLCLKLQNQNFRASHANRAFKTNNNNNRISIQQRQPQYHHQRMNYQQNPQQQYHQRMNYQQNPQQQYHQRMNYQQNPQQQQYHQQIPQRQQPQWQFQQQQPFYPELTYLPRNNQPRLYNNQQNGQLANHAQFQGVEPMEIDPTMQTQRINYAKRNELNNVKRPASSNNTVPRKHQRTFNIVSNNSRENNSHNEVSGNQNTDMPYELNDINFLD